jgi:hypothetical protein
MIAGQLVGLAASLATYVTAVWIFLLVQSRSIQALPAEWREHPELRERYEAALNFRLRTAFTSPNRAGLGWLAGFVVTFAVLAAAQFTIAFELTYIAVLALWWTIAEFRYNVAVSERLRNEHDLPAPPPERWRKPRRAARWGVRFFVWAGFLGTACFVGGLLAAPLR